MRACMELTATAQGAIDPSTGTLYLTFGDTQITAGRRDPGGIRFGWAGAKVAILIPND